MLGTFFNLKDARASYYSRCRMGDLWVDLKKAPVSTVENLNEITGISEIRSRITFPVVVDLEDVEKPLSGKVISMPEIREPVINDIILKRGSYFSLDKRNEVIVSEKFAKARNINPGSFIHLVLNGQRKKLFVTGTAICSEFIYLTPPGSIVPDNDGYGVFWIKRRYAEDLFGFHGACNSIVGLLTPEARKNPKGTMDQIQLQLEPYGVFTKTLLKNQYSNLTVNSEMSGLKTQATFLPIIFMGVAALTINVLMIRMAEQQRTIIGTLKALGVRNRDIRAHFLKFGLFVGLAGGLAGCVLGYFIASGMMVMYKQFFSFPRLENHLYPELMLAGIFISVFFAVLGTLRGVRTMMRLSPAEAMRPNPPTSTGKMILENWSFFWNRLDFRWQMVLRGIFRNKGRTVIGIFAAMFGGGILFLALGMSDSFKYMLFFEYEKILRCDYIISLRNEADYGAFFEVRRLPGVSRVEPQLMVPCHLINRNHSKKISITGIVPDSRLTVPRDKNGDAVRVPEVGFLINKRLANELHVTRGDYLTMIPVKGLKTPRQVVVAGIVETTFGLVVYADYNYLNKLINQTDALTSFQILGKLNEQEKKNLFSKVKRYPDLGSLSEINDMKKKMSKEFIQSMSFFTLVMVFFAGIIFFGSILNSTLISIAERQREIATFRVLGYQPFEVGQIFLRENFLINTLGALLGLPLGYLMLYGMAVQYQNDMFSMPCVVYPETWFYTPVIAIGFIIGAYFIIQRVINRMDWPEALKMKE
jgi:putative ABC transport system permease protein